MSFLQAPPLTEEEFPLFTAMRQRLGFIPNMYKAQTSRLDLIGAEAALMRAGMIDRGGLERRQKEYVFLAVSARNLSTYCVTGHCEIVRMLGIQGPEPEQIAIDHTAAAIPLADKALLNFAVKLNDHPADMSQMDVDTLRTFGFTDQQILETVMVTGLAQMANTISFGLGSRPDFENERLDFRSA